MLKKILAILLLLAIGLGLLLLTSRNSHFEKHRSLYIARSPQSLWQVLVDVDGWQDWWPGMERARLIGPLQVGSRIDLKFKGQPAAESVRLEWLAPAQQLGWAGTGVLGSTVTTRFELKPRPEGCEVLVSNSITGPQAVLARFSSGESFSQYQELFLKILEHKLQEQATEAPGGEKD